MSLNLLSDQAILERIIWDVYQIIRYSKHLEDSLTYNLIYVTQELAVRCPGSIVVTERMHHAGRHCTLNLHIV